MLSNILMAFSMNIDTVMLDLRQIPSIILAYFGGALPAIISVLLTTSGRFFISIDKIAYLSMVINITGVLFAWIFSQTIYKMNIKIFIVLTFDNLILSIFFIYINYDSFLTTKVLSAYWMVSYISAYLSFYILCYIRRTQMLFHKYQQDSVTDELTGLTNFRKFDELFNKLVDQTKENRQKLSLLYIDIDFFKQINDTYGHLEGDVVLKTLGTILQNSTRKCDIVSRIGGEELSVILEDCSLSMAVEMAEKIRINVQDHPFDLSSGEKIHLTISIGVASYPEVIPNIEQLISNADQALYQTKNVGRNDICIYDPKIHILNQ